TNATGSHKLPPYYIYEYEHETVKKYLKNEESVIFKKKGDGWENDIISNWYNNVFINLVSDHHQKTETIGKVILLTKLYKEFEDDMQNDNFEILFFPPSAYTILQSL
ncbi:hypothetical protein EAG_00352, partial [Camponotus floridanus]